MNNLSNKWVSRFLDMSSLVASWSRDPSTKVGAVLTREKRIVSMGFNGFPSGTVDDEKLYDDRERKYLRVVHAEKNAILFAKQDLTGCNLFATHFPCCQCAAFIIQSGISNIYVPLQNKAFLDRWYEHIKESLRMFDEVKVNSYVYDKVDNEIRRFMIFRESDTEDY